MKTILISLFSLIFFFSTSAQDPFWDFYTGVGGTGYDYGYSVDLDNEGNAYYTGSIYGDAHFGDSAITAMGTNDVFIARYDSLNELVWVKPAGGKYDDLAYCIRVDESSNVYLTGYFTDTAWFDSNEIISAGMKDIFVAKYDSAGNNIWAKRFGADMDDMGHSIAIDENGFIYVSGEFQDTVTFADSTYASYGNSDIFLMKLDNDGNILWGRRAGGVNWDVGRAIEIDSENNINMSGHYRFTAYFEDDSITSPGACNIFVSEWDSDGNMLWLNNAGGGSSDRSYALTIDQMDNVIVSGYFRSTAIFDDTTATALGNKDIFVAKYNTAGEFIWVNSLGSNLEDTGEAVICDLNDDIYVAGFFNDSIYNADTVLYSHGNRDIILAHITADGVFDDYKQIGGDMMDMAEGLAISHQDELYLTGSFFDTAYIDEDSVYSNGALDILIACQVWEDPTEVEDHLISTNEVTIYPNPTNGQINILFDEAVQTIEVYDMKGMLIQKTIPESNSVRLDLSNNKDGMYIIRITDSRNTLIKKVILQR